jgi:hypothetical protein
MIVDTSREASLIMWQMFLWVAAICIAFAIWSSLSRANEKMEATQRVVPPADPADEGGLRVQRGERG